MVNWIPFGTNCLGSLTYLSIFTCKFRVYTVYCKNCSVIFTKQLVYHHVGHPFKKKMYAIFYTCLWRTKNAYRSELYVRLQENYFDCTKIRLKYTNYRMQICTHTIARTHVYLYVCRLHAECRLCNQIWANFSVYITRKKDSQFEASILYINCNHSATIRNRLWCCSLFGFFSLLLVVVLWIFEHI